MEISLSDIYQEIKELRRDLVQIKETSIKNQMIMDALHKRVDVHEEQIKEIQKSLVGNVTLKTLHRWLIGAAGTVTALGVLAGFLARSIGK